MKPHYLELVSLIERLHRRFLELVQHELTARRIDDLNSVQAMILFNIGDAELTVGEMTARGCYHGSNVSYNVKKLVENGYLAYTRSTVDRRVVRVKLTAKAKKTRALIDAMYEAHVREMTGRSVDPQDLDRTASQLRDLEDMWQGLARP